MDKKVLHMCHKVLSYRNIILKRSCFLQQRRYLLLSHKINLNSNLKTLNSTTLILSSNVTVKELADSMKIGSSSLLKLLEDYGYATLNGVNTVLDLDIAEIAADEYGYTLEKEEKSSLLSPRPPVVTIMGHVDHGKTTLLDYLRETSIAEGEAGGITQKIGAFSVQVPGLDEKVTFIDTPGHAAFNAMRARGAKMTDVVVLVIAADDGIMEQTVECLRYIKEGNTPLIVAINKVDKPNANPDKIKRELLSTGIQLEEFGGDVKCIEISALKGTNIDKFLELLHKFSRENNFQSSQDLPVKAVVLEAESHKQKGIISSLLLKQGCLTKGKVLLAGSAFAKVRQIFDASGNVLPKAGPSDPVQILGWRSLPSPGDVVNEVTDEAEARSILKLQADDLKPEKVVQKPLKKAPGKKGLTEEFKSGRSKRIPYRVTLRMEASSGVKKVEAQKMSIDVIIKADLSGSLEAIVNILSSFHSQDIQLNIMDAAVGSVSETDLRMANTFQGIIYNFNTQLPKDILNKAEQLNIPVRSFDVIYKLLDDLKEEIEDRMPMKVDETFIGEADVLKVFRLTGTRKNVAAGCRVRDGFLDASDSTHVWRVMRGNEIVHEGPIKSLKHGHSDVATCKRLSECGVTLAKFEQFEEGDRIVCLKIDKQKQTIEWNL
ncbi:translation initiation factor IF-2-like [Hydractinia symbiolongicarpus]|uniref:translation initiation factor IF-2-like n=1 Tax=Hydractinia symbiolongicarpus TaxID=13093 RepID=UPI002550AB23|nr:translation initiation factor IF-2-like [Hydractinia symbiolongicarpus]